MEPGAGRSRTGRAAAGAPRSATEAAENGTGREAERGTEQKTVTFHKYSHSSYLWGSASFMNRMTPDVRLLFQRILYYLET